MAANSGPARSGTATIGGETFTVSQSGGCAYTINPPAYELGGNGGAGVPIAVTTASGCQWTAVANASWLHVTSGASGSASGTVTFSVDPYSGMGARRTGTITVGGQTFTVTQEKKD